MSMMDPEYPVVECYTNGEDVFPMACLNGLPIPYNTFVFYFLHRYSPKVKKAVPWAFKSNPDQELSEAELEADEILQFWESIDIPENMRKVVAKGRKLGSKHIIEEQISVMFERHIKKETPQDSFLKMVSEIDRIYANSFRDPVTI
jgi:hypothetical protein